MPIEISIVVPVHNESGSIEALVAEIDATMTGCGRPFETIFVDDASSDETYMTLQRICERVVHLRVLHHLNNCGQSMSIHTGVNAARGDIIATLDGDGQNDPADIPSLLKVLADGAGDGVVMVAGVRRKRQDTYWRRLSSRIANRFRGLFLNDGIEDTGCGLKVFYRSAFLSLPRFNHMHRFLPALIQRDGGIVSSVDVKHRPRSTGRSHYGTWGRLGAGLIDVMGVIWLRKRAKFVQIEEHIKGSKND